MDQGSKPNSKSNCSEWEQVFDKSQGFYFRYIITQLARRDHTLSNFDGRELLERIKQGTEKGPTAKKVAQNNSSFSLNGLERPFEIPKNWVWCRLGEIAQHNSGKTLDGGRNKGRLREYITTSNLYWGHFKLDGLRQMPIADQELDRCCAMKGDLLVCEGGEAGRAAVWESEDGVCFQNHIHRIRPYEHISSYFLFHFFRYLDFSGDINDYRKGMGISNLSGKSLSSVKVPLAPVSEQEMIVNFLRDFGKNQLDEGREYFDSEIEREVVSIHKGQIYGKRISTELDHQLALVKELRQAYLREAMQGKLVPQDPTDEPAEILLEKIKAEKEKLIAEKRIKRDKPLHTINPEELSFEIPSTWTWCRLGEISMQVTDGEHQTPPRISEGRMLLSAKNIRDGFIDFDNVDFISEEHYQKSIKRCKPEKGDVLIVSVGATIGRSTILDADTEFAIVRSVALIKPFISQLSKFFKFVLDSPILQKEISGRKWGTAQPCLYLNQIKELTVPLPPLAEQGRIVAKLEKLMKFCDELEANIKQGITSANRLLQTALKEALEPRND